MVHSQRITEGHQPEWRHGMMSREGQAEGRLMRKDRRTKP